MDVPGNDNGISKLALTLDREGLTEMARRAERSDLKGLFPVFLRISGRRALVVGGGKMATLRVRQLRKCGAKVTVVSPFLTPALARMARTGQVKWIKRDFTPSDVSRDYFLVIGATDHPAAQASLAEASERAGLLYNVVDAPKHCNFITPAVVERGDLKIAISTQGQSPALAGRLRKELDEALPRSTAGWTRASGRLRKKLKQLFPADLKTQKKLLNEFIEALKD